MILTKLRHSWKVTCDSKIVIHGNSCIILYIIHNPWWKPPLDITVERILCITISSAQREGLLSEASPDEEIADPFYAYCRQHAEKSTARVKRRNWLAVQSRLKQMNTMIATHPDAERVKRKLNRHRQKYIAAKQKRPPVWGEWRFQVKMYCRCNGACHPGGHYWVYHPCTQVSGKNVLQL